tara:strand:+ start:191576 stop:192310 length:735 start_codon:yes stop_codon:yes gene_type:complete
MKYFFTFFLLLNLVVHSQEKTTLYLIGDSTMADKKDPDENPEKGWGQMLPLALNDKIIVDNRAMNGRSSKSFRTEGRWKQILDSLKSGDFVFIQFGHNDQKEKDSTRYTNPYTQYRYNLERYVKETREKGATPILFSSITRRNFNEHGVLIDTHGAYPLVARLVADDLKVPFIDLQLLTEQLEISYGVEGSKKLHLHFAPGENAYRLKGVEDNTHLSVTGANLVVGLVIQEIKKQHLELEKYIK